MFVITNRKFTKSKGLKFFGDTPNSKGPNELRLVEVNKTNNKWEAKAVDDKLSKKTVKTLIKKYKLDIDENQPWYGSLEVACKLYYQAQKENKSILFFVHGYNNDVEDVLLAAKAIEDLYGVIVVPFTWPANGGGVISGTAAYLSDKSDARASAGALDRAVGIIHRLHEILTSSVQRKHEKKAYIEHPKNPSAAAALFTQLTEQECRIKINLLCHSMGNYVLKQTLKTSENKTSELVFDNICLVAADTNNENHLGWVGQMDAKKRLYVVINENDGALKASRVKPGKEQKARLGHYLKKLDCPNATYINVTESKEIGFEHTYFKGDAVAQNQMLKNLFDGMFKGKSVEHLCEFHADINAYKLK